MREGKWVGVVRDDRCYKCGEGGHEARTHPKQRWERWPTKEMPSINNDSKEHNSKTGHIDCSYGSRVMCQSLPKPTVEMQLGESNTV